MKITYDFIKKVHSGQVSPSPEMWAVEYALCNSGEVYYNPLKNFAAFKKIKKIALQFIDNAEEIKKRRLHSISLYRSRVIVISPSKLLTKMGVKS